MATRAMKWRVHTPNLLREVLSNPGTSMLVQPMNIFAALLAEVAQRATELHDPTLDQLMLRLALYEQGDPASPDYDGSLVEHYVEPRT